MENIKQILFQAEFRLNQSLIEYENESLSLAIEFRELKLQASIFQYEIC